MDQLRGKVTTVSFHVVYTDGSTKDSIFEPKEELKAILLSESFMTEEMKKLFTKSKTDWKVNPAMIIVDGARILANCDWPDCQQA
ncbi:hypothetical protein M0D69_31070 [Caballeronia sp. SEWSISQ10-4 2]|uniref:hypothetical protein n=1 Tax=Caballeronia sp. SEWSISQ10-4 2 TaxID=2937438 RepID=UPI00264C1158|nr:hypothetical protein [Caballeronia sp. SEWSISQ10-4 2]MDN7182383.1 hypothetical protein [Caballeronia sp. SEWSISQ10-4 2]